MDFEEEHEELQGLAFTITLCTLGIQDINSVIHRSHSLFIGVWDGGSPPHWDGCSIIKNNVVEWNPQSGLVAELVWPTMHDGWEKTQGLVSHSRLPKET